VSVEHFYWYLDRKAVESVLRLSWRDFLDRYPMDPAQAVELLDSAIEPHASERHVQSILRNKTLAWTVTHSTPALYVVNTIVHHVPALKRSGTEVWFWDCNHFETFAINAVAAAAFLEGRISGQTLRAVFAIHNEWMVEAQFDESMVSTADLRKLDKGLSAKIDARPLFSWLGDRPASEGYQWVREGDTALFNAFIQEAWTGNWPLLPLAKDVVELMELKPGKEYRIRNFPVARKLAAAAKKMANRRLCLVRYFELEVM
jgi:hypothetical protein